MPSEDILVIKFDLFAPTYEIDKRKGCESVKHDNEVDGKPAPYRYQSNRGASEGKEPAS